MKKVFYTFAAVTLLALGMTSCQKDQTVVKYTATIERTTAKTSVENLIDNTATHPVVWEQGDEITIFNTTTGHPFTFVTSDNNTDNAVFILADHGDCTELHDVAVAAGYPADFFHHQAQLQIPSIQNYKNHNVIKFPMYAVASTGNDELAFKNLCGILRIKMPKYGSTDLHIDITKVRVWANQQISGIFDIHNGGTDRQYLHPVKGPDGITMNFENPISLNGDDHEYIYIYLPAATYSTLAFQFYTTESEAQYLEVKSNQSITISRSQVHTIDLTYITPASEHWAVTPVPPSPNFYSVSSTLQVNFAKGNLLCNNGTWQNATSQGYISNNENNVIDHFARSTSGNNFGRTESNITDDFIDWGYALHRNSVSDYSSYEALDYRWRTLSSEEWDYLMYERDNALSLHYMVRIYDATNGAETLGFFIFPDGWTKPNDIPLSNDSFTMPDGYGEIDTYIIYNTITPDQYEILLNQGTFLPAAGHISSMADEEYEDLGLGGYYWASDYTVDEHRARQFWPTYVRDFYGNPEDEDEEESSEWHDVRYGKYFHAGQDLRDGLLYIVNYTVRLAYNAKRKSTSSDNWVSVENPNNPAKGKRRK